MAQTDLSTLLSHALQEQKLLPESHANITELLAGAASPLYAQSVAELAQAGHWSELNDRFFKKLSFGTSGLRGRTIGKIITTLEQGGGGPNGRPELPCVGTNALNHYNLSRATRGLVKYVQDWLAGEKIQRKARIVFSHDTRHFSRDFAEFCARIVNDLGADAYLFPSHRATPELSFAIRQLQADAGVMITASHNPAHDNGYKVYFNDGSSIVDPHAPGILREVNAITQENFTPVAQSQRGRTEILGEEMDDAYVVRLKDLLLEPKLLEGENTLKIVYTPVHGAGGVLVPRILRELGFNVLTVPEQDIPDGRFPTVKSPNPENAATLEMGRLLAEKAQADIVIATDPDCDRMGVLVRDAQGKLELLTGNQIGSLMAWYRVKTFVEQGVVTEANKERAALIKTFVTTDLQAEICKKYGIRCVETLTGFKYICAKMGKYEQSLPEGIQARYRSLTEAEVRQHQLSSGTFTIFGGEESYGYQGADFVRDKDGNGAVVMFAELAAYAKSQGKTIIELMNQIYCEYGYFLEETFNVEFEGASGAQTMRDLVESYSANPPKEISGVAVTGMTHYGKDDVRDVEGDMVPKENMIFLYLADGSKFAVRPSGTEPKMKYYFFVKTLPKAGKALAMDALPEIKKAASDYVNRLWSAIEADMKQRTA